MQPMPLVAVAPADAREIRPGALAAPQERMVVDELASHRVVTVTLGLRAERANHLTVAVVAAFTNIDIAPGQLQRRVRLESAHWLSGGALEEKRHDFDQAPDTHHQNDQHDEPAHVLLDELMSRLRSC